MARRWTVNEDLPAQEDKYEWRVPSADQQHVAETTAPSDLHLKPQDISLKPTKSPKESGIQHGADTWTFVDAPGGANEWYVFNEIVQEDEAV